jgi:hypothetical protein
MMQTLIILAKTIASGHMNHQQRDNRLAVVRKKIEDFIEQHSRSTWYVAADPLTESVTLKALYELAVWHGEHETHHDMKQRLRLFVEVAMYGMEQHSKAEKEKRENRVSTLIESAFVPASKQFDANTPDIPF